MDYTALKKFYLVRFTRRTGKCDTLMSGLGSGLLRMWALQNTTKKSKDTIIFDEDGVVHWYYEGTGDFPDITDYIKNAEENGFTHIDTFCEGMMDYIANQTEV